MIELAHDHMGQRCEAGLAARTSLCRSGGLNDLLAGPARVFGPHGADHAPLDGSNIKHLVAVFAKRAQNAAAIGTSTTTCFRFDPAFDTRQVIGQLTDRCRAVIIAS